MLSNKFIYSSVRLIASRILHEICLLIGELAIRGTILTLNARLGTKSNLLIEQLLLGEHYCIICLTIGVNDEYSSDLKLLVIQYHVLYYEVPNLSDFQKSTFSPNSNFSEQSQKNPHMTKISPGDLPVSSINSPIKKYLYY